MNKILSISKIIFAGSILCVVAQSTLMKATFDPEALKNKLTVESNKIVTQYPIQIGVLGGTLIPIHSIGKAINRSPAQIRFFTLLLGSVFITGHSLAKK